MNGAHNCGRDGRRKWKGNVRGKVIKSGGGSDSSRLFRLRLSWSDLRLTPPRQLFLGERKDPVRRTTTSLRHELNGKRVVRRPTDHPCACVRVCAPEDAAATAGERQRRPGLTKEEAADVHCERRPRVESHCGPRRAMGRRGQGKGRGYAGHGC